MNYVLCKHKKADFSIKKLKNLLFLNIFLFYIWYIIDIIKHICIEFVVTDGVM